MLKAFNQLQNAAKSLLIMWWQIPILCYLQVKFIPSEALRLKLKHSLKLDLELQMKMSQRKLCMKGSYEGPGVSS
ncbi:guanine nucleotide-binding protein subunit gamma [Trifolium repens]|nr:guanine nucleotide-binding protein subunit gamma [Trifolium repens]